MIEQNQLEASIAKAAADVRPGFENMMEQKVRSVDAILEGDVADGSAEKGE